MRFLYFLLFASFGVHAGSSYVLGKDLLSAVDAYSRAANLLPLKDSGPDELRVWGHDYMGRRVTGYVISESAAITCRTKYQYVDGTVKIDHAKCRPWHRGQDALAELDSISALNGKEWDCPMLDGAGVYIDGVRNGVRFALRVGNPDACEDENSKAVVSLLRKL